MQSSQNISSNSGITSDTENRFLNLLTINMKQNVVEMPALKELSAKIFAYLGLILRVLGGTETIGCVWIENKRQ